MSFFKKEIPKEEWERKYKEIAKKYDKAQATYSNGESEELTTEKLKKIAEVLHEKTANNKGKNTDQTDDVPANNKPIG